MSDRGFAMGFLAGALAGGLAAYLITQEEARDVIAGKAREAANAAMDATGDLRANAADLYARGKDVVDNARSSADEFSAQAHNQSPTTDF